MQFTRESIFVATIRSLCTAFGAIIGVIIALGLGIVALMSMNGPDLLPPMSDAKVSADSEGNRHLLPLSSPAILRINIHGIIGLGKLTSSDFENLLLDSREGILANDRVKGILLHIDTPGGVATDSATIYQMLCDYKAKFKVPIYAFVDGLCASGGVYITCACDKIFSTPSSIIGSVGVRMGPTFNFSKLMDSWGVQSLTLTEGKDKDMLNPYRPWAPGEDESLRKILADQYDQFLNAVLKARPRISRPNLIDVYGAQVYIASKAVEFGFIDEGNSQYNDALTALANAGRIHEDEAYQVIELSPPYSLIDELSNLSSSMFKGKITHTFQISPTLTPELSGRLLYLYSPPQ